MSYHFPVYREYKYFLTRQYPGLYRTLQEVTSNHNEEEPEEGQRFSMQCSVSGCKTLNNSLNETFRRAYSCSNTLSQVHGRNTYKIFSKVQNRKKPKNFTGNLRQSERFGKRFRAAFSKHKTLLKALLSQGLSQFHFKLLKNSNKMELEKEGRQKRTNTSTNSQVPAVFN